MASSHCWYDRKRSHHGDWLSEPGQRQTAEGAGRLGRIGCRRSRAVSSSGVGVVAGLDPSSLPCLQVASRRVALMPFCLLLGLRVQTAACSRSDDRLGRPGLAPWRTAQHQTPSSSPTANGFSMCYKRFFLLKTNLIVQLTSVELNWTLTGQLLFLFSFSEPLSFLCLPL